MQRKPMIILVMGVAGAGKTTIGRLLADELGWPFFDADAYHPEANVEKMRQNVPLTDADRWPWLDALRQHIDDLAANSTSAVFTCSALKKTYRTRLMDGQDAIRLVYLKGDFALIQERMTRRAGHYFKADLLRSQFDVLEEPDEAVVVDVAQPPEAIIQQVREALVL